MNSVWIAMLKAKPKNLPAQEFQGETAIQRLFDNRAIYVLLLAVVVVVLAVFRDFLLFKSVYLFKDIGSDSINGTWPHYALIVDYLRTNGIPKWSFQQGMGQSLFGVSTFEPFLSVFYLAGSNAVAYVFGYVEVLKIILAGLFFFLYLRTFSLSGYAAIVGGVLYSFTGYIIVGSGWYAFSYIAVCTALLLYGFEKLFRENKWHVLPIPIALVAAYQPVYVYLFAVLLFVYTIIRVADEDGWRPGRLLRGLFRLVPPFLLGLGLSSVFLFSNLAQIIESPRVGGEASYFHILSSRPVFDFAPQLQYVSDVLRLFSSDLLGAGSNFKGWTNYMESPSLYCGLVTLLLFPQFFCFIGRKQKILYAGLVSLCIVPMVFPYFRYAFWLFSGDYFREFSFFVSLAMLFGALRALDYIDRRQKVYIPVLLLSLGGCLALLYLPSYYMRYISVDDDLRWIVIGFLVLYTVLLSGMQWKKYRDVVRVALLVAVIIEAGWFSNISVQQRDVVSSAELEQRIGYNDYTKDAIAFIDSQDKDFFRVEKDYGSGLAMTPSINDAQVQGYRGTTSYSSFNQKYYIQFLRALGVIQTGDEAGTRWAIGTLGRPLLGTVSSVKYNLTKRSEPDAFGPLYEHISDFNDVHVYRNKYFLPLGFCYDSYLTSSAFSGIAPSHKDEALLRTLVVEDREQQIGGFPAFDISTLESDYKLENLQRDVLLRREETLRIEEHEQNRIRGSITVNRKKLLFLAIPYDAGWSAVVDGRKTPMLIANIGFSGLVLEAGTHTVELTYQPPFMLAGIGVSLFSLLIFIFVFLVPSPGRVRDFFALRYRRDGRRGQH